MRCMLQVMLVVCSPLRRHAPELIQEVEIDCLNSNSPLAAGKLSTDPRCRA